ncbi:probable 28S ribosomal protein S10, mitochondrial [Polypterus senegalus]|uniref:probable 28S ribosomal protein S10, mitochondrial n=1 Tax=Polypterus senegalus TaxID=55291 RepID=UPI0019665153|nr:probable 28S ribosomal protein S10, mitochondrial [Polypterus senegalus]
MWRAGYVCRLLGRQFWSRGGLTQAQSSHAVLNPWGAAAPGGTILSVSVSSWKITAGIHTGKPSFAIPPTITETDEADALYKRISVLVKGHDRAVLDSYEYFATLAASELDINVEKVYEPPKKIERLTVLKSVHIFKKHRVQYEMRTYYRCIELKHLTGSTAQVYLEYIQRNLPEGVAMEVTKTAVEKLPEHIKRPVWNSLPPVSDHQSQ